MLTPETSNDVKETSRSDRKRAVILASAREQFLVNGFLGTSMDEVAARAAVSKQTVYKHFTDKETLFREVVGDVVRVRDGGIPEDFLVEGEGSFEERLRIFARFFLRGVMLPEVLQLRRLVIGEVGRFPELGRALYDLGPKRAAEQLAKALSKAANHLGVTLPDSAIAAEHLLCLVLSLPLDRQMLLGDDNSLSDVALNRYADEGVNVFLRAYGFPATP